MNRMLVVLMLGLLTRGSSASETLDARARVLEADSGEAGFASLTAALNDPQPLVRRAAARALADRGPDARPALRGALDNSDALVRRTALTALGGLAGPVDLEAMAQGLRDPDLSCRETTVTLLGAAPRKEQVVALLQVAEKDPAVSIQRLAHSLLNAFHPQAPDRLLLRERPDMADHLPRIHVVGSFPLPLAGWRFRKDLKQNGHTETWFARTFDTAGWSRIEIGAPWDPDFDGIGWYCLDFELPVRPDLLAAEIGFEGVDESAWVWINGVYVGCHDEGPDGWNKPFRLDVTPDLNWGGRNRIAVRVQDTALAGGIWKPVSIEALQLK